MKLSSSSQKKTTILYKLSLSNQPLYNTNNHTFKLSFLSISMFDNLKKKLSGFFKSEPKENQEKKEAKKPAKAKSKKKTSKVSKKIEKTPKKQEKKEKSPKTKEIKQPYQTSQVTDNKREIEKTPRDLEEIPKEEIKESTDIESESPEEPQGFFSKLKTKLSSKVLSKEEFNEIFSDLEITLLENNTSLNAVDKIRESLEKDLVGISVKKTEVESTIISSLKSAISSILIEPPSFPEFKKTIEKSLEPYVILFMGINGSGKTTSIAKLANLLKKSGISVCLAAGDTFRAASIEQLSEHASKIKVPIIKSQYGSDPASVAFDAISYAKKNKIQAVLIDTAGRMYTSSNLMKEMEKIVRVSKPNLKLFVGESITGNDATQQASMFNETAGIDGIILSKADIDEKAGTILSVSLATNKPIYFLGTGQSYSDLTPFTKSTVLKNLGLE